MKRFLFLLNRAYYSLKILFDPAMEGNPYVKEEKEQPYLFSTSQRLLKNLN